MLPALASENHLNLLTVYTRPSPKNVPTSAFAPSKPLSPLHEVSQEKNLGAPSSIPSYESAPRLSQPPSISPPTNNPVTLPLNSVKSDSALGSSQPNNTSSSLGTLAQLNNSSQDNHVLNETLNVIDEHITDLRSPSSNGGLRAAATDSGSEYSSNHLDPRASYIQGEETDEEEEDVHTRAEVESWPADAVAEYLFTSGVEKHHCEVFRDQEITGEVLLGMDQSSLFIKAFDLGSVGRRLKTWHKIKALQDEVNNSGFQSRRGTQDYGSETGGGDVARARSRTNTLTNRPMSIQTRRLSLSQTPKASPTSLTPMSPKHAQDILNHVKRPSAASIRELHHSRRHSASTDFRIMGSPLPGTTPVQNTPNTATFPPPVEGGHKKQPSFDRNWTLGGASTQPSPRPLSSAGLQEALAPPDAELQDSAVDLDRGYFSGTEVDGRRRNVLRKRDSAAHSRKSSYAEEQRVRSATAISRHSRFGSMSSVNETGPLSAAHKYYGLQAGPHRRTASTTTTESTKSPVPGSTLPSPTVTKLDTAMAAARSPVAPATGKHQGFGSDWLAAVVNRPIAMAGSGMRAISDNLSIDRSKTGSPAPLTSPNKESSLDSPARTGSTTPSGGASFELDSPDATKSPSTTTTQSKSSKKKSKKETSAYTRGLLKISPKEAMKDADYSGWMKKKSSNLMTTWKPRLFVLKGRRLAYYYSEDDDQEKGLIDISFHRVLPADNERLTGLHETITSVVGGQAMPTNPDAEVLEKGDDSVFIFKLVPPRAGLSRAVNFTKPTVHYFAVPNLKAGRLWMAALMKATIDRDDTKPIATSYQQKTISLAKARQMRHRPPALMNEDSTLVESKDEEKEKTNGLGISYDADSGVSGVEKQGTQSIESGNFNEKDNNVPPLSA